jgi:L-arabinose isomerase
VLRGLGLYHGKRGGGGGVEARVKTGPITIVGLTQTRDGQLKRLGAEGWSLPGDILRIATPTRGSASPHSPRIRSM